MKFLKSLFFSKSGLIVMGTFLLVYGVLCLFFPDGEMGGKNQLYGLKGLGRIFVFYDRIQLRGYRKITPLFVRVCGLASILVSALFILLGLEK